MQSRPGDHEPEQQAAGSASSVLWNLDCEELVLGRLLDLMGPDGALADVDGERWVIAAAERVGIRTLMGLEDGRITGMVPPLRVRLPLAPWDAPDFLPLGSRHLASARLRAVLAPWAEWIEWLPVEVLASDAMGRAADYRLMRLFAHRPAFDLPASGLPPDAEWLAIALARRLVLRADAADGPAIFVADESPARWFVSDVVAARVVQAGCTGIAFLHPDDVGKIAPPRRFRGANGIVVR